jgi:hypothetical protein
MIFVFVALCIFIPVFSATGGILKVLPYIGMDTSGLRPSGGPGLVPMVLGFLGISVCLAISRTMLPATTQMIYCGVVTGLCWVAFIVFVAGFTKEVQSTRKRYVMVTSVPGRKGFDFAPVDAGRSAAVLANACRVPVRETGARA